MKAKAWKKFTITKVNPDLYYQVWRRDETIHTHKGCVVVKGVQLVLEPKMFREVEL